MKRMIAVRRRTRAFGRGTIDFLRPRNGAVLAFVRQWEDETVLVVANLSERSQPVELDLRAFQGATPVELLGESRFPPIVDRPYFLSLGPHGFYWFRLERRDRGPVTYGIEHAAI
jgi:maltose alpha-D-glucosyltransferase/alpha-amylase